jgi:hypothetical protein
MRDFEPRKSIVAVACKERLPGSVTVLFGEDAFGWSKLLTFLRKAQAASAVVLSTLECPLRSESD